jgi:hypothetical protein
MAKPNSQLIFFILLSFTITACLSPTTTTATSPASTPLPQATRTVPTATRASLYRSPEVPDMLVMESDKWHLPIEKDPAEAGLLLQMDALESLSKVEAKSAWIYVLVAAFPTMMDEASLADVRATWLGSTSGHLTGWPIYTTASTAAAFTGLWGKPASGSVRIIPADEMVERLWSNQPALGLIPFESLEPKLKVLKVDGLSPLQKDLDVEAYPLKIDFVVRAVNLGLESLSLTLPTTNRNTSRMTTIILSGVTALVRATAYTMEAKGVTYPARDIRDLMKAADITHISNEIPFFTGCDFPNPSRAKLVFCSDPKYIDLLLDVGTDVVELTGNHFADYGNEAMLETLAIYHQNGIPYYGGGANLEDAQKPLLLESNGNLIAFIGCNPVDWGKPPIATRNKPGAAPCNPKYLADTIADLKSKGYLVVATFQHQEYYTPEARPDQIQDFHLVADAGASIVSGSQAHYPQMMEFYKNAFIHYGLGNLFFDQMGDIPYYPGIRREFIDRYTIYDGKLNSVELLTMMLEDYSRPRPMTPTERASFLNEYFYHSGWATLVPTPTLQPTLTLTPMTLPQPFETMAPTP